MQLSMAQEVAEALGLSVAADPRDVSGFSSRAGTSRHGRRRRREPRPLKPVLSWRRCAGRKPQASLRPQGSHARRHYENTSLRVVCICGGNNISN